METWHEKFSVRAFQADEQGFLKIQSLFDYLQEAAGNHAADLGLSMASLLEQGRTWVLAQMRLTVTRWPAWREELLVETRPTGFDRLYCYRAFRIVDGTGAEVAMADSSWLVVDTRTKRALRVPEDMAAVFRGLGLEAAPSRSREAAPETAAEPAGEVAIPVRRSDLDLNRHVNNALYPAWALEAVPDEVRETSRLASMDIRFQAEAVLGDVVLSRLGRLPDSTFRHDLVRASDGRSLAHVLTAWRSVC